MTKIQLRRDTASNFTSKNPILAEGEAGFEIDTNKLKVGNGTSPWNELDYLAGEGGGSSIDAYTKAEVEKLLDGKANKFKPQLPLALSEETDIIVDAEITDTDVVFTGAGNSYWETDGSMTLSSNLLKDGQISNYVAFPLKQNQILKVPSMFGGDMTSSNSLLYCWLGDFDEEGHFLPYVALTNTQRSGDYHGYTRGGSTIASKGVDSSGYYKVTYTNPFNIVDSAYNRETITPATDDPIEYMSIYFEYFIADNGEYCLGLWTTGNQSTMTNILSSTFTTGGYPEFEAAMKKCKYIAFMPALGTTYSLADFKIYETTGRHGWNKAGLLGALQGAKYTQPMLEVIPQLKLQVGDGLEVVEGKLTTSGLKQVEITQSDYDSLTTKDPNTLYVITDGEDLSDKPYIVDAYISGYTGYLVYSNGYCVQWGNISSNVTVDGWNTINLFKKYKDSTYFSQACNMGNTTTIHTVKTGNASVNTQSTLQLYVSSSSGAFTWYTRGYLAEGEY